VEGKLVLKGIDQLHPLFLGSAMVAKNRDWLQKNGITAILNATSEVKNFYPDLYTYMR
jgi:hypothetical protein